MKNLIMIKENILISLLTYKDSVNVSFLWWLDKLRLLNTDPYHPRTYEIIYVPGLRPVAFARNVAVNQFINNKKYDKLWFIDDDLIPTETSLSIFDSNSDIVSGLYWLLLMENGLPKISSAIYKKIDNGFSMIDPRKNLGDNIIKIDAAGTGTLLISRKVFEDSKMCLPKEYLNSEGLIKNSENEDKILPFFRTQYKANGSEERSEDLDFVWRAKQLGYEIEANLNARFLHKKEVLIDWFI